MTERIGRVASACFAAGGPFGIVVDGTINSAIVTITLLRFVERATAAAAVLRLVHFRSAAPTNARTAASGGA